MKNIFLMGQAGAGKDTVANILRDYGYKTYALADPIREEYKRFFPQGNPRTDRKKLQDIGQLYKQLYGPYVWVKEAEKRIGELGPGPVVITDGRFSVEYDYFVNLLVYVPIRVVCDEPTRLERLKERDSTLQEEALKTESTELTSAVAHYIINNSNSLEFTREEIESILNNWR